MTILLLAGVLAALLAIPASASAVTPKIDTGIDFTCALDVTGSVKCWGAGGHGQLGNGGNDDSVVPVQVVGLTDAVDISVGHDHACAIRVSGAAVCWGDGSYGRIGNNSALNQNVPVQVSGLTSGVSSISAGSNHSCAVQNGAVKCWGLNSDRQLGDNLTAASLVPVSALTVTSGVTEVAAGYYHSCAIQNGAAKCWGAGTSGELGNGAGADSGPVVNVTGLGSGVTNIAAGDRISCAVQNGAAKCWGGDFSDSLGDGSGGNQQNSPVQVVGLTSGVTHIDALRYHVCALQNATVFCWGENGNGELGDGSFNFSGTPLAVPGAPAPATDVSVGGYGTCATSESLASCWGLNDAGQTGNGTSSGTDTPQDVVGLGSGVTGVDLGVAAACAVHSGAAKCWGDGSDYGVLGNGTYEFANSPVNVQGMSSGVTTVSAGSSFACGVQSGTMKCWGYDYDGQLGNGPYVQLSYSTPQNVLSLTPGTTAGSISAGSYHACAKHDAGAVNVFKCWGVATNGRLGNNATAPHQHSPVQVTQITDEADSIDAGGSHTCALRWTVDGLFQYRVIYCWGSDANGQLGNGAGSTADLDEPALISGTTWTDQVAAGGNFTCARFDPNFGSVPKCWGQGTYGQLGNGSYAQQDAPVAISGLTSASSIAAGFNHACAVDSGLVKCWGDNYEGQLGNGTHTGSNIPVTASGITNAVEVTAGGDATCARLTGGAVKCWGDGYYATIGNGVPTRLTEPASVQGYSPTPPLPAVPAPLPAKGAFRPSFKVGKIKRKSGKYVFTITATSTRPAGFTAAQACSGKLSGTLTIGRNKVKARAASLRASSTRCAAKLTFKSRTRPAKRKKYKLRAGFAGNDAYLKYAKTSKLVLRKR